MKIFLIFSLIIIAISFIAKNFFSSAKRNLFKDHAAWSGNDIKIKHNALREVTDSKRNGNYLKMIADESKTYLEHQYNIENDETK